MVQPTGPHGWRQGCWQEASPWLHLLVIGLSALGGGLPLPAPYLPSGGLAVTIGNPAETYQPAAASTSIFSWALMLCYTTWDLDIPCPCCCVVTAGVVTVAGHPGKERAGDACALCVLMTVWFMECPTAVAGTSVLLMMWLFNRMPSNISTTQQAH